MPSLKDLKIRINSVKSTQKITSAMKMVAAAKLRRAQEGAEAARPYAERMEGMVANVGASVDAQASAAGVGALVPSTNVEPDTLIVPGEKSEVASRADARTAALSSVSTLDTTESESDSPESVKVI